MPVIWVDILKIMQGTALQACVGGQELSDRDRAEKDGPEMQVKPLFSLPPQSAFLSFLLLLLFSDQAWWQTALTQLARDPESSWCHHCCGPVVPFTRAPSGAYRIMAWQLRSGKARTDRFHFRVFTMSFIQQDEDDKMPWNHQKSSQKKRWLATCHHILKKALNCHLPRHQIQAGISKRHTPSVTQVYWSVEAQQRHWTDTELGLSRCGLPGCLQQVILWRLVGE